MPVDPTKVDVVDAPEPEVTPTSNEPSRAPLQYVDNIEHYSRSELLKTHHKHKVIIIEALFAFLLFGAIILGVFIGPGLYKAVFSDPNGTFDDMLANILKIENEFHSVQSSGSFGLMSATYDRQNNAPLKSQLKGVVEADFVFRGINFDATVDVYGTNPSYSVQNIRALSVERDQQQIPNETIELVRNKWVEVPISTNFEEEGVVISMLEDGSNFSNIYGVLPITNVPSADRAEVYQQLLDIAPYQRDCEIIVVEGLDVVRCDVEVDHDALGRFYDYLSTKYDGPDKVSTNWPEKFLVFINTDSKLPTELRTSGSDTVYEDVMAFDTNPRVITEPSGAFNISDYRAFAVDFETQITQ